MRLNEVEKFGFTHVIQTHTDDLRTNRKASGFTSAVISVQNLLASKVVTRVSHAKITGIHFIAAIHVLKRQHLQLPMEDQRDLTLFAVRLSQKRTNNVTFQICMTGFVV